MTHPPACDNLISAVEAALGDILTRDSRRAVIALSGGSTPRKYMPGISKLELDWSRVDWMLADERLVARGQADSNEKLNRELIADTPMAQAGFIDLRAHINKIEPPRGAAVDLALLGMGDDGHIASLFPHSASLEDNAHFAIETAVPQPPNPQYRRLTLTVPSLLAVKHVFLVFAGPTKTGLWQKVLDGADPNDLPAAFLRAHPGLRVFDLS